MITAHSPFYLFKYFDSENAGSRVGCIYAPCANFAAERRLPLRNVRYAIAQPSKSVERTLQNHSSHKVTRGEGASTDARHFVPGKSSTGGFTLLELLIVLSILAIFLGLAVTGYSRYRAGLELQQAQQIFVQELNRSRSEARRLSQTQSITWTDKTLLIGAREIPLSESGNVTVRNLNNQTALDYTAPYGRILASEYKFELRGRGDLIKMVYVYGVTGKVKAVQ